MEMQFYCPNPQCQQPMNKVQDPRTGVTLDVCGTCNTVALNPGELEVIIAAVSSQPGFRPVAPETVRQRHATHGHRGYGARQHHSHHRSSPDGFFGSGGFFGS